MKYTGDIYKKYEEDRDIYTKKVLNSKSERRIVAAGPGTGKTHLFKEVCKIAGENNLILSFINELVNDIKGEIGNSADVRTLHSFAKKILKKDFFMELTEVIEEDLELITGKKTSFDKIFSQLEIGFEDELKSYSLRRKYYDYFGPYCSIYTAVMIFEENERKIPRYTQILIDEYQDFNQLEIKLIDLLSTKSPLLIAGDDDQSIYSFRYANPSEIRLRFGSKGYESFELPYCSRCPEVLVNAVNILLKRAKKEGYLKDRILKHYKYYKNREKDDISNSNPKILIKNSVYEKQVAHYLESEIKKIAQIEKHPTILVICPLKKQINSLKEDLEKKGFTGILTPPKTKRLEKKDGYKILINNNESNLGWRIIAGVELDKNELKDIVLKTRTNPAIKINNLLPANLKSKVERIIKILKKLKERKTIKDEEIKELIAEFDYDPLQISLGKIKNEIIKDEKYKEGYKSIPIKIVTMSGSKGLSADYVYLANFDDRYILSNGSVISDENISKFLVVLTRAKKRLTIFTTKSELPIFVQWLEEDIFERI